jgi:(S)-sulfolactate dehydrogenase
MKKGSILINSARGGIIDHPALVAALRKGHLGGAAIDVFVDEPIRKEEGALFAGVPNIILTPHISGVTAEANTRVSFMTAEGVAKVLRKGK